MASDAQVQAHLPLRPPRFEILIAIGDRRLHGYAILQAVRSLEGAAPLETGPLYRHLKRLLDAGLLRETDEPLPDEADDKRRSAYYELTSLGRACVRAEQARMEALLRESARLLADPEAVR